MTIKEISVDEMTKKLGANIKRMSPFVRAAVLGGASKMVIGGIAYKACSDEDLALVHKSAPTPRIVTELEPEEPKGTRLERLATEIREDITRERGPSERSPISGALEPEKTAPAVRSVPHFESGSETRIRLQREADARKAATHGKRPATGSKLARLLGGNGPKDAA